MLKKFIKKITNFPWKKIKPLKGILFFIKSWGHIITIIICGIIFFYYPVGGWLIHNIDIRINEETKISQGKHFITIKAISNLVNQEVNEKLWTPNLPFFFPSYFLDNMPNFQHGSIKAASVLTSSLNRIMPHPTNIRDKQQGSPLNIANEMLKYPGSVWLFSEQNNLIPAPSSTKQYRRAVRQLNKYNQGLESSIIKYHPQKKDLIFILKKIKNNLKISSKELEKQIREYSTSWIDNQADNVFYYNLGKTYGFYIGLKSLGKDYQDIIVSQKQYEQWTGLLHALEEGLEIKPLIVRNGELDSLFSPNHLAYLNYYIQKAQIIIIQISQQLSQSKE